MEKEGFCGYSGGEGVWVVVAAVLGCDGEGEVRARLFSGGSGFVGNGVVLGCLLVGFWWFQVVFWPEKRGGWWRLL